MSIHYRGDTFDLSGQLGLYFKGVLTPDLTGWTGRSMVRMLDGTFVEELTFEWLDATLSQAHVYSTNSTKDWPVGKARWDIELTSPTGKVVSTSPAIFEIKRDATYDS